MLEVQLLLGRLGGMVSGMVGIVGGNRFAAGADVSHVCRRLACGSQDAGDGRRKRGQQDRKAGDPRSDKSDPNAQSHDSFQLGGRSPLSKRMIYSARIFRT